jgi:hypothetical protein
VLNERSHEQRLTKLFQVLLVRRAFYFLTDSVFRRRNSRIDSEHWEGSDWREGCRTNWRLLGEHASPHSRKSQQNPSHPPHSIPIFVGCFLSRLWVGCSKKALDQSDKSPSTEEVLTDVPSPFPIVFINTTLGRIVRLLSAQEQRETCSEYHPSVSVGLIAALFTNSGIVLLFVGVGGYEWLHPGGLMVSVSYLTLSLSFNRPFVHIQPNVLCEEV